MAIRIYIERYTPTGNRAEDRILQHRIGLKLVRMLAASYNLNPDTLKIKEGTYGKPYFENCPLFFNISHTESMAAAAAGFGEVGIDCQKIFEVRSGVPERVCTRQELEKLAAADEPHREFIKLWTVKEAAAKLSGMGLARFLKKYKKEPCIANNVLVTTRQLDDIILTAMEENGTEAEIFLIKENEMFHLNDGADFCLTDEIGTITVITEK